MNKTEMCHSCSRQGIRGAVEESRREGKGGIMSRRERKGRGRAGYC